MKGMRKHWKTTAAGVATIALGVIAYVLPEVTGSEPMAESMVLSIVAAGVGLLSAGDGV